MSVLRLKEVLKEKKTSSKDLAELIEVQAPSISMFISGKNHPRISTLLKIATALDVDIRDLFNPTKPTTQKTPKEVLRAAINNLEVVYTEIDK